jgi:3-oxoadipate enol-lactonase
MVAQAFALKYPAQTGALILCSAVSRLFPELQQFLTTWVRTLGEAGGAQAFHGAQHLLFSRRYADTHPEVLKGLRAAVDRQPVDALRHLALGALNHDLEGRLGSIRTPTLVVVGEEDRLTPVRDARQLAELVPGATLTILPACGHVCPLERPAEFNEAVLDFVRSHDALLGLKMVAPGSHPSGASRLKS